MSWRSRSRSTQPPYPSLPLDQDTLRWLGKYYKPKEKKLSDFEYTASLEDIDSSVVDHAYYNVNDKTLAVVLSSEEVYLYSGVPSWVWSQFENAGSKGNFYNTVLKRSYGPANHLGSVWDTEIVKAGQMASVTPIRKPTFPLAAQPATVGTPKGLTYASDASVTTQAEVFPQGVRKATTSAVLINETGTEHTVAFDDKSTVDEALAEIDRLAAFLGVKAKVKEVTVHFE